MKIGDNILITESAYGSDLLTIGKEYEVLDFDFDGEPVVTLDDGYIKHSKHPVGRGQR